MKVEIDKTNLESVYKKARQLLREIDERNSWDNIDHSASKLGMFVKALVPFDLRQKWDN